MFISEERRGNVAIWGHMRPYVRDNQCEIILGLAEQVPGGAHKLCRKKLEVLLHSSGCQKN